MITARGPAENDNTTAAVRDRSHVVDGPTKGAA
jgi:hypothetical protein